MTERPRILFISAACPYVASFGAQLRTLHNARALEELGPVSFVLLTRQDPGEEALARTAANFDLRAVIPLHRATIRGIRERLRHELDVRYLNTHGLRIDDSDRERIVEWSREHDLVWVQRLEIANAMGIYRWPHTVIDLDDLKSGFHAQDAARQTRIIPRWVRLRRAWLSRRREHDILERCSAAAVCSAEDRATLGDSPRIHVVPNGFDPPESPPQRRLVDPPRLGFIGILEYEPNRDGLVWFADRVWPRIRADVPDAVLRVVGKGFAGGGLEGRPGIEGLGFVEDSASEIATWHGMIVPILFGGGTRIKIAESFSRRCPVVSTRPGAFGYAVESGRELLLADEPDEFAAACVRLIRDPALGPALAERGWALFEDRLTWDASGEKVRAAARAALEWSRSAEGF